MFKIIVVGLGGFLGAISRYIISGFIYRLLGDRFPYGTLFVNVLGCFLIGLIVTITEERFFVNPTIRIFLTVGLLGAFTTFSTFGYETIELIRQGSHFAALANVIYSVLNGLAAVYVGMVIGRLF
ncbi:MAG: fluoride efflux transporter CrcB [Calditrichaeota bacterium]|nr:MAG: fluoride efflux transporter CrcB [Calditrichota bacterium]